MRLDVHVIDCAFGVAAGNVDVRLRRRTGNGWRDLASGRTDADGGLRDWHGGPLRGGTYQLEFDLDGYYVDLGVVPFNPRAIVEFRISDPTHDLLVPLLITANSVLACRVG